MELNMCAVRRIDVSQREEKENDERYSVQFSRGGRPVTDDKLKLCAHVEEKVMEWTNAGHIHGWFVGHVQNGKDDGEEHRVSTWELKALLEVCEKVLNGSHLIWEPVFKHDDYHAIDNRMGTRGGTPSRVIKNILTAHKLLPVRAFEKYSSVSIAYDAAYLKAVEATRDWAERMLIDDKKGAQGDIYYLATSSYR